MTAADIKPGQCGVFNGQQLTKLDCLDEYRRIYFINSKFRLFAIDRNENESIAAAPAAGDAAPAPAQPAPGPAAGGLKMPWKMAQLINIFTAKK